MGPERRWCIVWTWGGGRWSDHRVLGPFTEKEAERTWEQMRSAGFPGGFDIEPLHTMTEARTYLEEPVR